MSYCPPPLPLGRPHGCPFVIPLLTPHFPFFSRSSPSPAPSAYPTCALQAVPELQPSPCRLSGAACSNKEALGVQAVSTAQAQPPFMLPGGSEMPILCQPQSQAHNIIRPRCLKACSLLLVPQLFLLLTSRHKDSQSNGGCSLLWWCW